MQRLGCSSSTGHLKPRQTALIASAIETNSSDLLIQTLLKKHKQITGIKHFEQAVLGDDRNKGLRIRNRIY